MSITYRIDSAQNLIFHTFSGEITRDDFTAHVGRVLADPSFRPGMGSYGDFTGATVFWSMADIDRFRDFLATARSRIAGSKWAAVIPKGKDATSAKIFAALTNALSTSLEVQVFRDRYAAMEWLQGKGAGEKK